MPGHADIDVASHRFKTHRTGAQVDIGLPAFRGAQSGFGIMLEKQPVSFRAHEQGRCRRDTHFSGIGERP